MSNRKKLDKFLSALARSGGQFQLGTTPQWWADKSYRRCEVNMASGDKIMVLPIKLARIIARELRLHGLTEIADGLDEMVEIAAKMDRDKPTIEQARAEYQGPSAMLH